MIVDPEVEALKKDMVALQADYKAEYKQKDTQVETLKKDMTTLQADYRADFKQTDARVTKFDGLLDKLKSDQEQLQRDKAQLLGVIKVLTAVGIFGAAFVGYLTTQWAGLSNQVGSVKGDLQKAFDNDMSDL